MRHPHGIIHIDLMKCVCFDFPFPSLLVSLKLQIYNILGEDWLWQKKKKKCFDPMMIHSNCTKTRDHQQQGGKRWMKQGDPPINQFQCISKLFNSNTKKPKWQCESHSSRSITTKWNYQLNFECMSVEFRMSVRPLPSNILLIPYLFSRGVAPTN